MAKLYIIKDVVADVVCAGPLVAINDATATRNIKSLLDSRSPSAESYRQNPADYEMWYIGEMDDKTGCVTADTSPQMKFRFSSIYEKPIEKQGEGA